MGVDSDRRQRTDLAQKIRSLKLIYPHPTAEIYAIYRAILIPDETICAPRCTEFVQKGVRRSHYEFMNGFLHMFFLCDRREVQPQLFDQREHLQFY